MAENSKIAWTTHTFNPWRGCTKVSEGCKFCYAETLSHRNPAVLGVWGPNGTREIAAESAWREPVKWNRAAAAADRRDRVFCASLSDVFEGPETMPGISAFVELDNDEPNTMPILGNVVVAAARERLFALIDATPHLDWLLLTKRPQNVMPLYGAWLHWNRSGMAYAINHGALFPPNVWIGTSVENQNALDIRAPHLLRLRQFGLRVAFFSAEPLLEGLDLRPFIGPDHANWVIVGGESGHDARPFDTNWARSMRDQCGDAGVPFFMKQTGTHPITLTVRGKGDDWDDIPADIRVREFPSLGA